jgi:hypothetical protein
MRTKAAEGALVAIERLRGAEQRRVAGMRAERAAWKVAADEQAARARALEKGVAGLERRTEAAATALAGHAS